MTPIPLDRPGNMRLCASCGETKPRDEFWNLSTNYEGKHRACIVCKKQIRKRWYDRHAIEIRARQKEYYRANTDACRRTGDRCKKRWKAEVLADPERLKVFRRKAVAYRATKYKTDIQFRLGLSLRHRLKRGLRRNEQKAGSAVRDLGCSVPFLKTYLESLFKPGMSWSNWAHKGWHIDHIVPLSAFDLTDREQFLRACHYTNLQPLWAAENLAKGGFRA